MDIKKRHLKIDVYDYSGNALCTLYDSDTEASGQAHDVFINSERNGWKELIFEMPTTYIDEYGEHENYRLDFLKADLKIRTVENYKDVDWFILTEPKVNHSFHSKNVSVSAGHICQFLKTKKMDLEFSQENGGVNTATAYEFLKTILEGTGWYVGNVDTFYEKNLDHVEKRRSLVAGVKTGAFKLISSVCDLFEAKPVYHGEGYPLLREDPGDMDTHFSKYCKLVSGEYQQLTEPAEFEPDTYYAYKARYVDIIHMNPFEKPEDGSMPDVSSADTVLEMRYGNNVKTMSRTLNTENMITQLHVYGGYGTAVNGYCGINELDHKEMKYTSVALTEGEVYYFTVPYDSGDERYHFTAPKNIDEGTLFIFSDFDPASKSYIWNEDDQEAYFVDRGQEGSALYESAPETTAVKNQVEYLMDFDYYKDAGLISTNMLQSLARFQRGIGAAVDNYQEKNDIFQADLKKIRDAFGYTDFAKLQCSVRNIPAGDLNGDDGRLEFTLDTENYPHGVIYRTDYDQRNERELFHWLTTIGLKDDGQPINYSGSLIIVFDKDANNLYRWRKMYVKAIVDGKGVYHYRQNIDGSYINEDISMVDDPKKIIVWSKESNTTINDDSLVFIFKNYSISSDMGVLADRADSVEVALRNATSATSGLGTAVTERPTYFVERLADLSNISKINGYAWAWVSSYKIIDGAAETPQMYFCYYDVDKSGTTPLWRYVHYSKTEPVAGVQEGQYWYQWSAVNNNVASPKLYRRTGGEWVQLNDLQYKNIIPKFGTVYDQGFQRTMLYQGSYEDYVYTNNGAAAKEAGNYFMDIGYNRYVSFSTENKIQSYTDEDGSIKTREFAIQIPVGGTADYNTSRGSIEITGSDLPYEAKISTVSANAVVPYDSYGGHIVEQGTLDAQGKEAENSSEMRVGGYIYVYDNITYKIKHDGIAEPARVYFYNSSKAFISSLNNASTFTTPAATRYIRFVITGNDPDTYNSEETNLICEDHDNYIVANNEIIFKKLTPVTHGENPEIKGIINYINVFANYVDQTYITDKNTYIAARDAVAKLENDLSESFGDMFRQGFWQKNDYVDGDEQKLYDDAIENIKQAAKPAASYNVDYLDLFHSIQTEGGDETEWPDISIMSAVHVIDEDIDVNIWAYIDKIQKCYDDPRKTKLSINTDLSTITQKSFTDVMTNIANIASEVKAKTGLYDRASAIQSNGKFAADRLQGSIDAHNVQIKGASSTWYTDEKGNMIFISGDGNSAMTLTGNGFAISDRKDEYGEWIWRTFGDGRGFTADEIIAGYLSAERIEAGSITADHLSSGVGESLDISSNREIVLIAGKADAVKTDVDNIKDGTTGVKKLETSSIVIAEDGIDISSAGYINIESAGAIHIGSGSSKTTLQNKLDGLDSKIDDKKNNVTVSLYTRSSSTPSKPYTDSTTVTYNFGTGTLDSVPSGWSTSPVTGNDPLYVSSVKLVSGDITVSFTGSSFSTPTLFSTNGKDGTSFTIKYTATSVNDLTTTHPASGEEVGTGALISGGTTAEEGYLYIIVEESGVKSWMSAGKIQGPQGPQGEQGHDGQDGKKTITLFVYKKGSSSGTMSKPEAAVYTFATQSIDAPSGGTFTWCLDPQSAWTAEGEGDTLYISTVTVTVEGDAATAAITADAWKTPLQYGNNGYNACVVQLYKQSNIGSAPSAPQHTITYNFSTGKIQGDPVDGWSMQIPASTTGKSVYYIYASASSKTSTDDIDTTEWSAPTLYVRDGTDGDTVRTATLYLYTRDAMTIADYNANRDAAFSKIAYICDNANDYHFKQLDELSSAVTEAAFTTMLNNVHREDIANKMHERFGFTNIDYTKRPLVPGNELISKGYSSASASKTYTLFPVRYSAGPSGTGVTYEYAITNRTVFTATPIEVTQNGYNVLTSTELGNYISGLFIGKSQGNFADIINADKAGKNLIIDYYEYGLSSDDTETLQEATQRETIKDNLLVKLQDHYYGNTYSFDKPESNTYHFNTNTYTTPFAHWSQTIPTEGQDKPLYVTTAVVSSTTDSVAVASDKWSDAVRMAQDGASYNSAAVFLYKRSANAPSSLPGRTKYNFMNGTLTAAEGESMNGWTQSVPASDASKNPCYCIYASASSMTTIDEIATSEWSTPTVAMKDGEKGDQGEQGNDGKKSAVLYLYQRKASAPTLYPADGVKYSFSTNEYTGNLNEWSKTIPSGTNPLYITTTAVITADDEVEIDHTKWSTAVILSQNGTNGVNQTVLMLYTKTESSSTLTKPATTTYTFADNSYASLSTGWYQSINNIPSSYTGPIYYVSQAVYSNAGTVTVEQTNWSTPATMTKTPVSYAMQYATNDSATVAPTTGWSYAQPTGQDEDDGRFCWTRIETKFDDGSTIYSNPVIDQTYTFKKGIVSGDIKAMYAEKMIGDVVEIDPSQSIIIKRDGLIDIQGAAVDIASSTELNIVAGGDLIITSRGESAISMDEDGMTIASDYDIRIEGSNVDIDANGTIDMAAGSSVKIGAGNSYVQITDRGVYLEGTSIYLNATNSLDTKLSDMDDATAEAAGDATQALSDAAAADTKAVQAKQAADAKPNVYRCTQQELSAISYKVLDIWYDTASSTGLQYVCNTAKGSSFKMSDWSLVGTSLVGGAKFTMDAATGNIEMGAGNNISIASGNSINIAAGEQVSIAGGSIAFLDRSSAELIPLTYIGESASNHNKSVGSTINYTNNPNVIIEQLDTGALKVTQDAAGHGILFYTNKLEETGVYTIKLTNTTTRRNIYVIEENSQNQFVVKQVILQSQGTSYTGDISISDANKYRIAVSLSRSTVTSFNVNSIELKLNPKNAFVINGDGISINTGGTLSIASAGKFTIASPNFTIDDSNNVTITGNITAESGQIGGWNIVNEALSKSVTLSGTTYDTGMKPVISSASDIVFYAGEYSAEAGETDKHYPFEVHADGSVYLKKLYALNEQGQAKSPVNLSNYSFWKIDPAYARSVATVSTDSMTLRDGTVINFKKAGGEIDHASAQMTTYTSTSGSGIGTGTIVVYGKSDPHSGSQIIAELEDMTIIALPAYQAGENSVTLSQGEWSHGAKIIEASNGRRTSVIIPEGTLTINDFSKSTHRAYVEASTGGMLIANGFADASEVYSDGHTDGYSDGWSSAANVVGRSGNTITCPSSDVGTTKTYTATSNIHFGSSMTWGGVDYVKKEETYAFTTWS